MVVMKEEDADLNAGMDGTEVQAQSEAGLITSITTWVSGWLSSLEGIFFSMGMYVHPTNPPHACKLGL